MKDIIEFSKELKDNNCYVTIKVPKIYDVQKHNCVLGVYATKHGNEYEVEMYEYLHKLFNVYVVVQEPSAENLFEYPALKFMEILIKKCKKPCLYLHTKGAGNPRKLQDTIREFWQFELTHNYQTYIDLVKTNEKKPLVSTMFTGKEKHTWFNCFVVNEYVFDNFTIPLVKTNRWFYECLFKDADAEVLGVLATDIIGSNSQTVFTYLNKYINTNMRK
jgi:hypothetical protein